MLGIIICSYVGPFASYVGINLLIFVTVIVYLLMMGTKFVCVRRRKLGLSWTLLMFYLCFNSLFNMPKSLFYLMLVVFGFMILKRNIREDNIEIVKNILRVVTVALSISIIVQVFASPFFTNLQKCGFFTQINMIWCFKLALSLISIRV